MTDTPTPEQAVESAAGPRIRSGLLWALGARLASQAVQFSVGVALARLLGPEAFGTIGMLLVFSGFAQVLVESGLTSALIQKQQLCEVDASTVFWIQLAASSGMAALFFAAGSPLADFFDDPKLTSLYHAFSCIFVIQSLGSVQEALLQKQGRFRYLATISTATAAVSGTIALLLAWTGFGPWALLWQLVTTAMMYSLLLWLGSSWRPALILDRRAARELGSYGLFLLGHNILGYWLRNGANLVIGRVSGPFQLGLYTRSYSLMMLPVTNISAVFGQVMFPALAARQHDKVAFRQLYLKGIKSIAFVSFPTMVSLCLLSRDVVLILFGPRWFEMIPLLQVFSLVGLVQSIISPAGWVYTSLGRTRDMFIMTTCLVFVFVMAMWIGAAGGLYGITLAYAGWAFVSAVVNLSLVSWLIGTTPLQLGRVIWKTSLSTLVMAAGLVLMTMLLADTVPLLVEAILSAAVAGCAYLGVAWLLRDAPLLEGLKMMRGLVRRRRSHDE